MVVEAVHPGAAGGVGGQDRRQADRLLGQEGVAALAARRARAGCRFTATWIPSSGSGLLTGQSLPAHSAAPAGLQRPERVLPARPALRRGTGSSARPSAARGSPTAAGCWRSRRARRTAGCRRGARPAGARGGAGRPARPLARRAAAIASSALRTARSPSAWKCTWKPSWSSAVTYRGQLAGVDEVQAGRARSRSRRRPR